MMYIYGGTFDPLHMGHMAVIKAVYEAFGYRIDLMPTCNHSYKGRYVTDISHRVNMLNMVCEQYPFCSINFTEINHSHCSNTYNTLSFLKSKFNSPIFFIMGMDSFATLSTWDSWEKLFNLTNFIVVNRPGYYRHSLQLNRYVEQDKKRFLSCCYGSIFFLDIPDCGISSTDLRETDQGWGDMTLPEINEYATLYNLYSETSV